MRRKAATGEGKRSGPLSCRQIWDPGSLDLSLPQGLSPQILEPKFISAGEREQHSHF